MPKNITNIVVIGASGHAKVIIDIIEKQKQYCIVGLIDTFKPKKIKIFNYEILGTEDDLPQLMVQHNFKAGIIAVGDNWIRKLLVDKITNVVPNFEFVTAIHPSAVIGKNVEIGRGTVIMAGAIINCDTKINDFCIINTKASLDHDGNLKNYSSLAPNATVGGHVTVGSYSAICLGANILQDITIGKHSIVGAGALVNKNVEDYKLVYGVPAKSIRDIGIGEKYLYQASDYVKPYINPTQTHPTIEIITNKTDWNNVLHEIEHHDFYHTYDYHYLSKADDEKPMLVKYQEGNILIALPLLVREISGTPYKDATSVYGYAGPISKNLPDNFNNTIFIESLTNYFKNHNFVTIFSRLNPFIKGQYQILNSLGDILNQGKVVNINIQEDSDLQRQKFQSRLKTHINKARRCCSVKIASTEADWRSFTEIYYENMDRVHAKPFYYFNEAYFKDIKESENFESIVLIAVDNKTGQDIAACQFVLTNGIVQYHLSGTKTQFLNLMPTKLLIDEMRLIATKRGFKFFNLGGGLGGSDNDTLFNFKSSFSKDFKDFYLWKYIVNANVYNDLTIKQGFTAETQYFPKYRATNDFNHV